uniref:WW domain-containing protein n=1 Tax=Peronospora matthiolae TaxID=2874970 RepID=A0AAV1UI19_9STRA
MPPESHQRVRRQRSPTRGQSRPRPRPGRSPSRPRHDNDVGPRKRSDPLDDQRSRARHRQQEAPPVRAKSRPPPSGLGSGDGRGPPTSAKRPRVRFSVIESEGAAGLLSAKATYSGLLRKQADNQPGAWNEYYFVVKPLTYLLYYNSKDDETPRGIIDLEYLSDVKRNADCLQRAVGARDNCFRVSGKLPRPTAEQTASGDVPKMRPLFLDARDDDDALEWMQAIRNHRFSLKKDQQFAEVMLELRDVRLKVELLEAAQQEERRMTKALRVKAKTLLQKMRAVEGGSSLDDVVEADELGLDDTADEMLAMLEGMEDVLVNLQMQLSHQKQQEVTSKKGDKAGPTRRGFTQVIQRAVTRREVTGQVEEVPEDDGEETLAAIRNRRQRKLPDPVPVIQEEHKVKAKEKTVEKGKSESSREKLKEKLKANAREEPAAAVVDNVSDVLAMWKAKKKSSSNTKQAVFEDDVDRSGKNSNPSSTRGMPTTLETSLTSIPTSRGSERLSEEDTASLDSTDEHDIEERLPPGWTKHESRGYPGTYYYANEDGKVSWEVPTVDMDGSKSDGYSDRDDRSESGTDKDENAVVVGSEYEHRNSYTDTHSEEDEVDVVYPETTVDVSPECQSEQETDDATAGGTTSAAYRKLKPKPKSAWAFKLPKLLPTTTQVAPPEVTSSSPILRGANHHEF